MNTKAILALIIGNTLLGINFTLYSSLLSKYIEFNLLFAMIVLSNAIFYLPSLVRKHKYKFTLKEVILLVVMSVLIVYGKEFFLLWGVERTNSLDASTLATITPVITLVLSSLYRHEKMGRYKIIGIMLILGGSTVLMVENFSRDQGGVLLSGNIFIFISLFSSAAHTVYIKKALERHHFNVVMAWVYLIGILITAPYYASVIDWSPLANLPLDGVMQLLVVLVFGTALPSYLIYYAVERLTSTHTALFSYFQPLSALILGIALGLRLFYFDNIIGLVLISMGVYIVVYRYRKENRSLM